MKVKNRWNGKSYTVKNFDSPANEVTLIREDGSEFSITQKEYRFSYREYNIDVNRFVQSTDRGGV